jgi:hypothetical protein
LHSISSNVSKEQEDTGATTDGKCGTVVSRITVSCKSANHMYDCAWAGMGSPLLAMTMYALCRFPEDSIFFGREIPTHIFTRWADHSMMEAVRLTVRAALADPLNQRFVLVSETCLPLYPPTVIYQQLMHEDRSRIDACAGNTSETSRLDRCARKGSSWGRGKGKRGGTQT